MREINFYSTFSISKSSKYRDAFGGVKKGVIVFSVVIFKLRALIHSGK